MLTLSLASLGHAVPTRYQDLRFSLSGALGASTGKLVTLISDSHESEFREEHAVYSSSLADALNSETRRTQVLMEVPDTIGPLKALEDQKTSLKSFLDSSYYQILHLISSHNQADRLSVIAADSRPRSSRAIVYNLKQIQNNIQPLLPIGGQAFAQTITPVISQLLEQFRKERVEDQCFTIDNLLIYASNTENEAISKITEIITTTFPSYLAHLPAALGQIRTNLDVYKAQFQRLMASLSIDHQQMSSKDIVVLSFEKLIDFLQEAQAGANIVLVQAKINALVDFMSHTIFLESGALNFEIAKLTLQSLAEYERVLLVFGDSHNQAIAQFCESLFLSKPSDKRHAFIYQELALPTPVDNSIFFGDSPMSKLANLLPNSDHIPIKIDNFKNLLASKLRSSCWTCGKGSLASFSKCSQCKQATYCSKGCQTKSWQSGHKQECQKITR